MRNKNLFVCGDINLNLLKQTPDSEHYLIKMASYGLDSKINDTTRITNNSQKLIDHAQLCACPPIDQVKEILGLVLDSGLTWKTHIDYIESKLVV